ncbi:unnamed protein product [Rhodiola kirilowii]
MIVLCWNCRGMGNARTVRALKDAIDSHRPQVVCLIETKVQHGKWGWLRVKLGFRNCFVVDPRGSAGGLAILWRSEVSLFVRNYSRYHVDVFFEADFQSRLTLFYGHPTVSKRKESWDLIRTLCSLQSGSWVLLGDFNEVLRESEVQGIHQRSLWQIEAFRRVIGDCGLVDLGYTGYPFTFSNRRQSIFETKARLDRVFVNKAWLDAGLEYQVKHLTATVSDHSPILLYPKASVTKGSDRNFRFEPMWLRHGNFMNIVADCWEGNRSASKTWKEKLELCADALSLWNKREFGNVKKRVEKLKMELEKIRSLPRTENNYKLEEKLSVEIDEWLAREELLWRQRSRVEWLNYGDKNTKFFHARASQRKKRNFIARLRNKNGDLVDSKPQLNEAVVEYFQSLFQPSVDAPNMDWNSRLTNVHSVISAEMNRDLVEEFTEEEVRNALFQMCPTKAPGPDGFSALFYQKCWNIVKADVVEVVLRCLNSKILDRELNSTNIVLIPKVKDALSLEQFRPISLCNVIMKIISKSLVNRLQRCLDKVISSNQSAFVQGRIITDNILLAQEINHYIKCHQKQKKGFASLKLDMSKAFDRLEWGFIENMMLKLGFARDWVEKVMLCVTTVSYRVKVNNWYSDLIVPGRGLRQGDPLSPYLFIICSEWLSREIMARSGGGVLKGISVARGAPKVTHLFFADDCMVYLRANANDFAAIKSILENYEAVAGQRVNYPKSEVYFSPNVEDRVGEALSNMLGVSKVPGHSKYLGLPLAMSQKRCEAFNFVVDKLWSRVSGWKENLLSIAGKEVLIKSVLLATPLYTMSCFSLPAGILSKLTSVVAKFWWSNQGASSGIHWVRRDKLEEDKSCGGLGFRSFKLMNDALIAKQVWRIITRPDLLMSKVMKARYFPNSDYMDANVGSRPSMVWRSLFSVKHILKEGLVWDAHQRKFFWNKCSSGLYSTRSGYEVAKSLQRAWEGQPSDNRKIKIFWNRLWRIHAPSKVKILLWRLFHNSWPVAVNLASRGISVDVRCQICGFHQESILHLLSQCWWSKALWNLLGIQFSSVEGLLVCTADWLWKIILSREEDELLRICAGVWFIWRHRNEVWHGKEMWDVKWILRRVEMHCRLWQKKTPLMSTDFVCDPLKWKPPKRGFIKINCDGAWCLESNIMGFAGLARDDKGVVMVAFASWKSKKGSALEAEGRAILQAMEVAGSLGWDKVVFELDSFQVISGILAGGLDEQSKLSWSFRCSELFSHHPDWELSHVWREANNGADALAKKACKNKWSWLSTEAIPICLSPHCSLESVE